MATALFLERCKAIFDECCRNVVTADGSTDNLQPIKQRLETLERSIRWARGPLVQPDLADELLQIVTELLQFIETSPNAQEGGRYAYHAPTVQTSQYGRRSFEIKEEQLKFLLDCGFRHPQIAVILGVSLRTIERRVRQYNLSHRFSYVQLSDSELDQRVKEVIGDNEQMGAGAVWSALRATGLRVQRQRVRESLIRVSPAGAAQRALSHRLHRRTYSVAGPNSLWHIDGNHKLIRWRIVIHGGICGFSRMVVFLKASDNNRSNTVLEMFLGASARYGVPSRVRCDDGGENNDVCLFMNVYRGSERGSAIRGRSVHNQRIERLWGDVWRGVTNVYHQLFSFLENERVIDCTNEKHMWALHYVYLPQINKELELFRQQWNNHGLRTAGHLTPTQLFVQGSLQRQMQPLTAMAEIFGQNAAEPVAANAVPTLTWEARVTVPSNQFTPTQTQMEELQQVHSEPGPASFGIQTLQQVLTILAQ